MPATPLDLLAGELGAIAGRLEREVRLRVEAAISELQRRDAERELRFLKLERALEDRIASLRDGDPGKSVSVEDVRPLLVAEIGRRFSEIPAPKDGKDAEPVSDERVAVAVVAHMANNPTPKGDRGEPGPAGKDAEPAAIAELVSRAVAALPAPKDGRDADPEFVRATVAAAVAALPPAPKGDPGPMGSLPAVRAWEDRIHYQGDVVTSMGSLYQAARDTAKEPPHIDWTCLAAAGKDGADGRSPNVCGTYDESKRYTNLDVVVLNGGAFIARRDNPGPCPGDGWQLQAKQGSIGKPGPQGPQGPPGPQGPKVEEIMVDGEGLFRLRLGDGSVLEADFYPVFAKLK